MSTPSPDTKPANLTAEASAVDVHATVAPGGVGNAASAKTESAAVEGDASEATTAASEAQPGEPGSVAPPVLALGQIQGNSLGGFSKDSQAMLFLRITNADKAAATLRHTSVADHTVGDDSILADVRASTSEQVVRFNAQFKQLKSEGIPEGEIKATWTNLVFTKAGLEKMLPNGNRAELDRFPKAFLEGMAARAKILGDTGDSAPDKWEKIVNWSEMHALLIVASDEPSEVNPGHRRGRIGRYLAAIQKSDSGLELCAAKDAPKTDSEGPGQIYGATRADDPGHEHFGFKDGVSQPGVRGVDMPDDPVGNPDQGHPGQDLLHPGEFIIGYPRQLPVALGDHDGPNPLPSEVMSGDGPVSGSPTGKDIDKDIDPEGSRQKMPAWAKDGSFLVFRRLEQDVLGFRKFILEKSVELGMSEDLFGAKIVGRYKSGAPLEKRKYQGPDLFQEPVFDPGRFNPALGDSDALNNNFEYGDDAKGEIVPLAAHIRKAYPRDEIPLRNGEPTTESGGKLNKDDSESRVQTHRLLRRGIPYGRSLFDNKGGNPHARRGLLFLAYQSDIERQFEFVQQAWVANPDFPSEKAGRDPLITPRSKADDASSIQMCPFHKAVAAGSEEKCPVKDVGIQRFVTTRGGGYFFSPSIAALDMLLRVKAE